MSYCQLKVQKNLRKGLTLLNDVTREVLRDCKQRKFTEISVLYNQFAPRPFDKAFQQQHGADHEKYHNLLVDKLAQYKQAAAESNPQSGPSSVRSLWRATKLASQLHRSCLFIVILTFAEFSIPNTNPSCMDKIEKHLRKAVPFLSPWTPSSRAAERQPRYLTSETCKILPASLILNTLRFA